MFERCPVSWVNRPGSPTMPSCVRDVELLSALLAAVAAATARQRRSTMAAPAALARLLIVADCGTSHH